MNKKSSLMTKLAGAPYIVWAALFIIVPLCMVAYYAFTDKTGAFTFSNMAEIVKYADTFILSIWLGLLATVISLVVAYPLAMIMASKGPEKQSRMTMLIMLPMWISLLIRTYSLMALLDNGGLVSTFLMSIGLPKLTFIGTDGAVILGMIYDFLPYMVLPIYTSLLKIDRRYLEASDNSLSRLALTSVITLSILYHLSNGSSCNVSKNSSTSYIPDGSTITLSYPHIAIAISLVLNRLL